MKKMCNRVLAMLLTVVMMLSVLPLSVFASWLDVEAENTQSGNVVSGDIKVTVSAKEFLTYLKNGDLKGLLKGISVDGLRGVVSVDELFEIIPKEQFAKLVDLIKSDIKSVDLAKYIDMEVLLESVDMDALIALVKDIPNLQDYVKDYDALMKYIDQGVIADAVDYIDVDALVDDYADELIDLALTLDADKLASIVDVNAALEIDAIDFSEVLDVEYFESLDNYMDYIDEDGLHDFIVKLYDDPNHRLDSEMIHHFVDDNALADILMDPEYGYLDHLGDFIDPEALKDLVKDKKYDELKAYLDIDAFIGTIMDSDLSYAELKAKGALDTDKLFAAVEALTYVQLKNSGALDTAALFARVEGLEYSILKDFVDTDALFPMIEGLSYAQLENSGALNTSKLHALIEGLTYTQLKDSGALNTAELHTLIEGLTYAELKASGALTADDLFDSYSDFAPYLDDAAAEAFLRDKFTMDYLNEKGYLNGAVLDIDAMYAAGEFTVDELICANALNVSIESLIFDETGAYYYEILIDEGKLVPTALFSGTNAKWTVEELIDSNVIVPKALFVGDDAVWSVEKLIDEDAILPKALFVGDDAIWSVEELIDGNIIKAKELFVGEKALWDVEKLVDENVIEPTKLIYGDNAPLDMDQLVEDGAILPDALLFDSSVDANGNTKPYYFGNLVTSGIVKIKVVVNGDAENNIPVLFKIIELEEKGVIDFKKLAFGDPGDPDDPADDVKGLFEDIDILLKNDVFDLNGMLHEWYDDAGMKHAPLFTFEELVAEGVVLEDKLIADGHTYDKLVDIAALEKQLQELLENGKLTTDDVMSCLKKDANGNVDYNAAIEAIGGVEAIIDNTDLTYTKILTEYVVDFAGLMNELGLETTLRKIIDDGALERIFDVNGLIEAIGIDKLMELVDVRSIVEQLINKEVILDVVQSLSPEAYLAWVSELLNILSRNVLEIKINGVAVTEKPFSDVLVFNSEKLLACVQAAIPTLNDLANIDDEGTLLSLGFAITYASEATDGVAKTKEIGVSFCVAEGAAQIRKIASAIEKLLGKFLTYSYNNGDFAVNVKIPDEFASVIAYALNTLGADADPELIKLKDDLLGLYDANLSDMANFVGNVTFGQIITILDKIDSDHFERAYNAVLRQRYVALMVDYIAEATGVDLSALPLDVLMRKLENIPALPTLEQIAQKVEDITGRDLVSKLPTRVQNVWVTAEGELVTDLLSRLGARYGADFDLQGILETVAGQEDPIAYLYDSLIAKMEMAGFVYNAASSKLMSVANRALASSIGQKLDTIRINNYYRGDGTFGFNVDFSFSPEAVLQKGIDKVINFVLSKREFNTEYIDKILTIVYALISDSTVTVSFDASVTVSGLYKAEFYNEDGELIRKVFLPAGANLALMVGEYTPVDPNGEFLGWKDATSENTVYYTVMPYTDMKFIADVDTKDEPIIPDEEYTVTVIDPDTKEPVLTLVLKAGESLADYKDQLEALVGELEENQTLTWHKVVDGVVSEAAYDLSAKVAADMTLTWKITTKQDPGPDVYYNVSVDAYDENGKLLFELTEQALEGTSISGFIASLDLAANENYPVLEAWEKAIYKLTHVWTNADDSELDTSAAINGDLELKVVITRDHANASLKLDADTSKYSITYLKPYYYVTWHADAWDSIMELTIDREFLTAAVANGDMLVMDATDTINGHRISLDATFLTNLLAELDAKGIDSVVLSYTFDNVDEVSGANEFSFSFLFDGVADGDFFGNGRVEIRMPFAGRNSLKVKTYLYIDGEELAPVTIGDGSIVLAAPHFSEFKLVNKYQLTYTAHKWEGVDESLLGDLASIADIATKPVAEGYYEAGEEIAVNAASILPVAQGVKLLRTEVLGQGIAFAPDATGTFTMPAEAVTLQQIVTIKTYYIYYYVGGALDSSVGYTKFSVPTWAEIAAHVPTASVANGGTWFGIDTSIDLAENLQDLYLFLIWEGEEKIFTMSFTILNAAGEEVTFTIEHTVGEWLGANLALLQAEIDTALLNVGVRADGDNRAISWLNGTANLNDYTMDDWKALMEGADSVAFVGRYEERKYTIYSDGNLTLNVGDSVTAGTLVEFTVIEKIGMTASVSIFVNGIETVLTANFFEMPEGDVVIKVTYSPKSYSYTDANGNAVNDALYGDRVIFTVVIPAGKVLPDDIDVAQLAGAPAGLSLISMESGADGSLILTYAFDMTEETNGINLANFIATVRNYIVDLEYKNVYVVDGKSYPSKKAAEAALPEGVVVKEWKQVDKNLFVAVLAYEGEESPATLIALIIILVVLILILVIALLYTLYICGKLAPNWFLKVITAIVTVFFKACMAVAAAGLAIARLFGYEEAALVEEETEPEEAPVEEPVEEAAEGATEEASEEATEEATEESAEEATEENTEAADAEDTDKKETNE